MGHLTWLPFNRKPLAGQASTGDAVIASFAAPFETAKAKRADAKDTDDPNTGKRTMSSWLSQFEDNYRSVYEPADEQMLSLASAAATAIIDAGRNDVAAFDEIVARFETLRAPPVVQEDYANSGWVRDTHCTRLTLKWILDDEKPDDSARGWMRGRDQGWGGLSELDRAFVYAAMLAKIGGRGLDFAAREVRNEVTDDQRRALAVILMCCELKIGEAVDAGTLVRALTEMLANDNKAYRILAVIALSKLGQTASPAVDALLGGIRTGDLLCQFGDDRLPGLLAQIGPAARPLLLDLLRYDPPENAGGDTPQHSYWNGSVRAQAAKSLGSKEFASDDVVAALTAALADAPAKRNAINSLARLGAIAQTALPSLELLATDLRTTDSDGFIISKAIGKIKRQRQDRNAER